MRVRDFRCLDGHITERFLRYDTDAVQCDTCHGIATKIISAPRFTLEGVSGDFPGAAMKWDTRHEKAHADHVKQNGFESH
jgi:hypothetical protein